MTLKWQMAITTCRQRVELCDRTIQSLYDAGFLFSTSSRDAGKVSANCYFQRIGYNDGEVRYDYLHDHRVGAFGNWLLTAWELYLSDRHADRYAIFQDDIRASKNLREYLETTITPEKSYQNLILYPANYVQGTEAGSWYPAPRIGQGAQGLVFSNVAMKALLKSPFFVEYAATPNCVDGIDGTINAVMAEAGFTEYVHYPSLLDHVDSPSTLGHPPQPKIDSFRGEQFDLLELQR